MRARWVQIDSRGRRVAVWVDSGGWAWSFDPKTMAVSRLSRVSIPPQNRREHQGDPAEDSDRLVSLQCVQNLAACGREMIYEAVHTGDLPSVPIWPRIEEGPADRPVRYVVTAWDAKAWLARVMPVRRRRPTRRGE